VAISISVDCFQIGDGGSLEFSTLMFQEIDSETEPIRLPILLD